MKYTIEEFAALVRDQREKDGFSKGGAQSYASTIRTALAPMAGRTDRVLVVGNNAAANEDLIDRVAEWAPNRVLTNNPRCALRAGLSYLEPGDKIVGYAEGEAAPRTATVQPPVWPPPTTPVATAAMDGEDWSFRIPQKYIRKQFIGRLASQERYYPNLGEAQACVRYPALLFRLEGLPDELKAAFAECLAASQSATFFVTAAADAEAIGQVQVVRAEHVDELLVELLPDGSATVRVITSADALADLPTNGTLVQRTHRPGSEFERLLLPASVVRQVRAAAGGSVERLQVEVFKRLSLDHAEPFADIVARELPHLDGLRTLTKLIAERAGHTLGQRNARYFTGQRPIYKQLLTDAAFTPELQRALAADLRRLNRQVRLEVLSTSSNSRRGRGQRTSK